MKPPGRSAFAVLAAGLTVAAAPASAQEGIGPAGAGPAAVPSDQSAVLEAANLARQMGDPDAPIRIVEISDFQCPFCARYHEQTWPLVDSLYVRSGIARYLWVSFPNSRHSRAWPAVEAAFCAGAAGRFWPMHDILFETREEWSEAEDPVALFLGYAARAGVEEDSFAACLRNDQTAPLQVSDYDSALRSGISSTPFFIVGDSLAIQGAVPPERFRAAVDSVLAARDLPLP